MKKSIACVSIFLLFILMAGVAGASTTSAPCCTDTWSDKWTPDGGPVDFGYHDYHSYTYQHDLGNGGFNADLDEVYRYRLKIGLRDDSHHDRWEWAFIDLPGHRTDEWAEVDFSKIHLGWSWKGLAGLNDDGLLDVTIKWLCGDFKLTGSKLIASGESGVHAPVPASVLMLASGLVGLVGYRRRWLADS